MTLNTGRYCFCIILLLYNAINTEASYAICEDFILQLYVQICDRKISKLIFSFLELSESTPR